MLLLPFKAGKTKAQSQVSDPELVNDCGPDWETIHSCNRYLLNFVSGAEVTVMNVTEKVPVYLEYTVWRERESINR